MDPVHVHLILNHFPIVGALVMLAVLIYGFIVKSDQVKQVAMLGFVIMALATIPVYLTGDPAHEAAEDLPGVSHDAIHEHEESGELSFIVMMIAGVAALLGSILSFRKHKFAGMATVMFLILGSVAFGFMARTGYLGGQIRHTELRPEGQAGASETGGEAGEDEEDDHDHGHDDDHDHEH